MPNYEVGRMERHEGGIASCPDGAAERLEYRAKQDARMVQARNFAVFALVLLGSVIVVSIWQGWV